MKSKEFILWLRGFTEGVHEYNITPKQWDLLKEKLAEVDDAFVETPGMFQVHPEKPYPGVPIGEGGWGTPNHDLVERYPWGGQKIWAGNPIDCSKSGTTLPNYAVTTTPGTTGFVTFSGSSYTPAFTGSADELWKVSTSTTYTYPSGSLWHYTNGGNKDIKE